MALKDDIKFLKDLMQKPGFQRGNQKEVTFRGNDAFRLKEAIETICDAIDNLSGGGGNVSTTNPLNVANLVEGGGGNTIEDSGILIQSIILADGSITGALNQPQEFGPLGILTDEIKNSSGDLLIRALNGQSLIINDNADDGGIDFTATTGEIALPLGVSNGKITIGTHPVANDTLANIILAGTAVVRNGIICND